MKINERVAGKMHRLCQIFPGLTIVNRSSHILGGDEIIMEVPHKGGRYHVCQTIMLAAHDVEDYIDHTLRDMAHNVLDSLLIGPDGK